MKITLVSFLSLITALFGNGMQEFASLHVPLRPDGKIDIPENIKHIRLDIGLSYSAPMSQQWLSNQHQLIVFGFEPDPSSVHSIKQGAIKQDPSHGDPLEKKYVGTNFFVFPCALGLVSNQLMNFFVTKESCGCSSLYLPSYFEVAKIIEVPVFRLSDFFELIPFDTHPVVDYIKIDAQGSDLDIIKSAAHFLKERVVYVTLEAENNQYQNTMNSEAQIDDYMRSQGFVREYFHNTSDPTYFNPNFIGYIRSNNIKIYQRG